MSQAVSDVDTLQRYIAGVVSRANHHAHNVNEIALALVGAIIWRKDATEIKVMTRDGEMTNVLWVSIGGKRYAFSYNHGMGTVEMREGTLKGNVLASFNNATSIADLMKVFEKL